MRISNPALWLVLALGVAGAAACGPATPEPVTPAASAAPATSAAPAASTTPVASVTPNATPSATPAATGPAPAATPAFSTMTNEQKLQHMKVVIRPEMGKVFSDYDGKRYGEFGCRTCHGDKKQDPHMVLPKLTLSGDGFQKLMAAKPAVMKFMSEKVTPAMAVSMGEKPFDPATHKGFGCGGCHTVN